MDKTKTRTYWSRIALAVVALGAACALSASPRSAPAETQNGGTTSGIGGPVQLMRGQRARLSAFVPAALRGDPKTLDLKFAIRSVTWTVVGKSFEVDRDCPWASVELEVTPGGDVVFEHQTIGTLPAGVASIDIAGHEISHGVTGNAPATASALEVSDGETGVPKYALQVSQGGGAY
ncbi:MAG: hypothetical protein ACJ74W_14130 [Pyrinomonadaceae bacterium]